MESPCTREKGFTLIEALMVIGIIAVLSSLAGPPFVRMIADQRAKSTATDLYTALTVARSEAIKLNQNVTLQPKTGGWAKGWIVPNPNGGANLLDANATNVPISGAPDSVTYNGGGRLIGGSTVPSFTIGASDKTQRCLTVDLSGRPRIKASAC